MCICRYMHIHTYTASLSGMESLEIFWPWRRLLAALVAGTELFAALEESGAD